MPTKMKVVLGIGLIGGAVALGTLGPAALGPRSDPGPARAAAEAAARAALDGLRAHERELEGMVTTAARVEPLRAALTSQVDGRTLIDLFETEDWWRPHREAFALARVVLGNEAVSYGALEMGEEDRELVSSARKARVASGLLVAKGQLVVAAAARIDAVESAAPVLVAARPFAEATLRDLAERTQLSLALAHGGRALMIAGAAGLRADLEALAKREGEATALAPSRGWAAARVEVTPGIRLWALKSTGATGSGAGLRWGIWGVATLVALVGFAFLFASRRRENSAAPTAEVPHENTLPFGTPQKARTAPDRALVGSKARKPPQPPIPVSYPANDSKPRTFGRYRLVEMLGVGGMSEIYTAVAYGAEGFARTFVIKRLRPELAHDKEAVAQFIDEARMQASLVHSNIVPVFDFGTMGDEFYMAQEYILGRDLMRISGRCVERTEFCLDPRVVYYIMHETLQALAYAHSRRAKDGQAMGIVHRDVSASNIMLSQAGEVKLFDFGIAKANGRQTKTQAGMVKGNANFMSPEQARGQPVDPRSDLYSLGLVLYFSLTNQLLFNGDNDLDILYRAACGVTEEDWALIDRLPAPAPQILRKALAFAPGDRFQTAEEFAAAVAPYAVGMKPEAASLMQLLFGEELREEAAA